jgi:hypothetical protein
MLPMMTLCLAFLCVALFSPGEVPEIVIRGRVVDPAGAAIAGASIRALDEASRNTINTAVSDQDGKFSVDGLAAGSYLLVVSAPGFQEKQVRVDREQDGISDLSDLRLEVLDCDAPLANCDRSGAGNDADPHPVIVKRDMSVNAGNAVDLQNGELVPKASAEADIRVDSAGGALFLVPLNKAAFTTSGAEGSCGKTRNQDPLRIDGLGPAVEIVVVTRHKQCARLFVISEIPPGADQATLHIVTRSR